MERFRRYIFVTEKKCTLKQNFCSEKKLFLYDNNLGKRVKNQNHKCTIYRNTTNSFMSLGSNYIQFSTNTEKEQVFLHQ